MLTHHGKTFRSQNSNAGTLDPEFNAFEAGVAVPPLPDVQHPLFNQAGPHIRNFPQNENTGWASDFQKLQLSDPAYSAPQPQFQIEDPRHVNLRGWQSEFMHGQHLPPAQQQESQAPSFQGNHNNSLAFMNNRMVHGIPALPGTPQTLNQATRPEETFDESAFEAAFDQARAEVEMQGNNTVQDPEQTNVGDEEQLKIGSDTIPHVENSDTTNSNDNSDELARTAGHLLDSISHDQSQKFKDSNFLALMRRIRDREVRVEGDQFRDVSTFP